MIISTIVTVINSFIILSIFIIRICNGRTLSSPPPKPPPSHPPPPTAAKTLDLGPEQQQKPLTCAVKTQKRMKSRGALCARYQLIGVPFRVLVSLVITYLLSPPTLQVVMYSLRVHVLT